MAQHTLYHVSHVSNEHSDWLRGIDFYKDELHILENRLSEVSQKWTKSEVKADVEHYQNQFIIQKANLSDLQNSIKQHEVHMSDDVQNKAQHLSNNTLAEHDSMRERYQILERTLVDLRHDFNKFLSRYM